MDARGGLAFELVHPSHVQRGQFEMCPRGGAAAGDQSKVELAQRALAVIIDLFVHECPLEPVPPLSGAAMTWQ